MHILKQLRVSGYDAPTNTVTCTQPQPPARGTDTQNQPVTMPATGYGVFLSIELGAGAAVLPPGTPLDGLNVIGRTVYVEIKTM